MSENTSYDKDYFVSELYLARWSSWNEVEQVVELAKHFLTPEEVNEVLCEIDDIFSV